MLKKETFLALFKNKFLLLALAIVVVTTIIMVAITPPAASVGVTLSNVVVLLFFLVIHLTAAGIAGLFTLGKKTFLASFDKLLLPIVSIWAAQFILILSLRVSSTVEEYLLIFAPIALQVVFILGVKFLLSKAPPKMTSKPARLEIKAEPAQIIADGEAKSILTIQLLDEKDKPVAALEDTEVKLTATAGSLENPVIKIPKGKETEKTVLISSSNPGPVTLSADSNGLQSVNITLNFLDEKKRFCMHCGVRMPFKAPQCPKCGMTPPAGLDTKVCENCQAVIPVVAKFCSECGAGQPKWEQRQNE